MNRICRRPFSRLWHWSTDCLKPHRWWIPANMGAYDLSQVVKVPTYKTMFTKAEDPCWRDNQPWTLFEVKGGGSYYVFYLKHLGNDWGMRVMLAVHTPLFALRVSKEPLWILVVDKRGMVVRPQLVTHVDGSCDPMLGRPEDIKSWAGKLLQEVTFI